MDPLAAYQQANVQTAGQGDLILLLYNGCIRFLQQARIALHEQKLESAHHSLVRAQDILAELLATLDKEAGGKVAENLASLYEYGLQRLVEANLKKQAEPIDEVIDIMNELRSAWEEIIRPATNKQGAAMQPPLAAGAEHRSGGLRS